MKRNKQKKLVLIKKWCKNLLAQPQPQFYTKPMLYISGDEMELKNFCQLLEYTDEHLGMTIKNGALDIYGANLFVVALEKERILIKGTVFKIEFSPQRER